MLTPCLSLRTLCSDIPILVCNMIVRAFINFIATSYTQHQYNYRQELHYVPRLDATMSLTRSSSELHRQNRAVDRQYHRIWGFPSPRRLSRLDSPRDRDRDRPRNRARVLSRCQTSLTALSNRCSITSASTSIPKRDVMSVKVMPVITGAVLNLERRADEIEGEVENVAVPGEQ